MSRFVPGIFIAAMLLLAGGTIWLSVSDAAPAPQTVRHILPDANFPR